ncbi:hypothetical protein COK03_20030 [Priestia megaterium]|nr:hypothetical protein CN492_22815 [Priestia megaterium]PFP37759.1 hypothetical protein COK03_20030 [Priestia megaterium]
MSNTIVHHHFGHLMEIDVAYFNLQAMQKMKELFKMNMAYYAKGINYTRSENNYKEMQRVSCT